MLEKFLTVAASFLIKYKKPLTITLALYLIVYGIAYANITGITHTTATAQASTFCADGTTMTSQEFSDAISAGALQVSVSVAPGQSSGTVVNNTSCTAPVSMSSYKMFEPTILSSQQLFSSTGPANIGQGTNTFTVDTPTDCQSQVDIWYGTFPTTLSDTPGIYAAPNNPYVINWGYPLPNAPFCSNVIPSPTPTPTPTETPSPSPSPTPTEVPSPTPSPTPTPTPTEVPSPSPSPSPTPTPTPTPTPSISPSPTPTPTMTPTPTPTPTATPTQQPTNPPIIIQPPAISQNQAQSQSQSQVNNNNQTNNQNVTVTQSARGSTQAPPTIIYTVPTYSQPKLQYTYPTPSPTPSPSASPKIITPSSVNSSSQPQVVYTAGQQATELPRTGLPLAGIILASLLPGGFALKKKFGTKQEENTTANYIWEERELKK